MQSWNEIRSLLEVQGGYSAFELNPPASAEAIRSLEQHIGLSLPQSLKDLLGLHNGQGPGRRCGLFFGDEFLSVAEIQAQWDNWKSLEDESLNEEFKENMSSNPPGFIKPLYHSSKWVPFTHDGGGNHSGLDFDPDVNGQVGQIIAHGRDVDEKLLLADSFESFLDRFHKHLLASRWSLAKGYWEFEDDQFKRHYHAWFAP